MSASIAVSYRPVTRSHGFHNPHLRLVNDNSRAVASKVAFQASLERAQLNQKYWDEILEKLRKSGGGGGSSQDFDRIKVSLQLINFLSNKAILALLKNGNVEFLKLTSNMTSQLQTPSQNQFLSGIQKFGFIIFSSIAFIMINTMKSLNLQNLPKSIINLTNALTVAISLQLNKLKEILLEEFKELGRKLDLKDKIRRIKKSVSDFFVQMKEEIINVVEWVKSVVMFYAEKNLFPSTNTGTPRKTQKAVIR